MSKRWMAAAALGCVVVCAAGCGKKDVRIADLKDVEDSNLGLKGSPTQIARASDKVRKGAGEKVNLDVTESVDYIIDKLKVKHVI